MHVVFRIGNALHIHSRNALRSSPNICATTCVQCAQLSLTFYILPPYAVSGTVGGDAVESSRYVGGSKHHVSAQFRVLPPDEEDLTTYDVERAAWIDAIEDARSQALSTAGMTNKAMKMMGIESPIRQIGGDAESVLDPMLVMTKEECRRIRKHPPILDPNMLAAYLRTTDWTNDDDASTSIANMHDWAPIVNASGAIWLLHAMSDSRVRTFAVDSLDVLDLPPEEIRLYLPQLIQALKGERLPESSLADYLLRRGLADPIILGLPTIWQLRVEAAAARHAQPFFRVIITRFLEALGTSRLRRIFDDQDRLWGQAGVFSRVNRAVLRCVQVFRDAKYSSCANTRFDTN